MKTSTMTNFEDSKILRIVPTPAGSVAVMAYPYELQHWVPSISNFRYEKYNLDVIDSLEFVRFHDVGAAFGFFAHYVNYKRPDVEIWAYEPEPFRFACLETTTGDFHRRRTVVGSGPVQYNADGPGGMYSVCEKPELEIKLPGFTDRLNLGQALWREVPTLVKMDIEGNEYAAIKSMREDLRQSTHITYLIELHHTTKEVTLDNMRDLLPSHDAIEVHASPDKSIRSFLFVP